MNDYGGLSSAVREELKHRTETEYFEQQAKKNHQQKTEVAKLWQKFGHNILLLLNKAPK